MVKRIRNPFESAIVSARASLPHSDTHLPPQLFSCLRIKDHLREQRELAQHMINEASEIYQYHHGVMGGAVEVSDPRFSERVRNAVSVDRAIRAYGATDHTTLKAGYTESASWMRRMAEEANMLIQFRKDDPYTLRMRSLCAEQAMHAKNLDYYREHPELPLTVVLNYGHGADNPEQAYRNIANARKTTFKDLDNVIDVDTVAPYRRWMAGDRKGTAAIMAAEAQACRDYGFIQKFIIMVSAHSYMNQDPFESKHTLTTLAHELGIPCTKTSTGHAGEAPFNHFVTQDTGPIARAAPMIIATGDFNRANNAICFNKFSGGNSNIVDVAIMENSVEYVHSAEVRALNAYGTSPRFRKILLEWIAEKEGDNCGYDLRDVLRHSLPDLTDVPQHKLGLPKASSPWHYDGDTGSFVL